MLEKLYQGNRNVPATGGYKQIGHDGTSWLKIRWKSKAVSCSNVNKAKTDKNALTSSLAQDWLNDYMIDWHKLID